MNKLDSYKKHFKKALNNYEAVLIILDRLELELPYDAYESFPENWTEDPLLLFGQYLEILKFTKTETDEFRISAADLVECNGAEWFWGNRMRLAAEIEYIRRLET